jgi:ferritin
MLSNNLLTAINDQIKHELYSAYFYLSMSAWTESHNMPGAAKWLSKQAQEEQGHAMKLYGYLQDRGAKVTLQAIPQPPAEFTSLLDVFEQVKEHEAKVTGLIHRLYETSLKDNDYASQIELQWFVTEQVEEEKNAAMIVDALKSVGTQGAALFMVDHWLGERE